MKLLSSAVPTLGHETLGIYRVRPSFNDGPAVPSPLPSLAVVFEVSPRFAGRDVRFLSVVDVFADVVRAMNDSFQLAHGNANSDLDHGGRANNLAVRQV